ncbi:MAG: tetratricopeptide repeat protein [Rubrivivax sp.]|nr:tetratricopeptide repeat protein [Rubrivivax sp.]MDH5338628.1 tetratricopeptide repeat protein [Rubrivivax sp.]
MVFTDCRGVPCSSASASARDAAERALWRMMSFYEPPLDDLDRATAHDPGWALPHLMKAGYLLSLTEAALVPEAAAHLALARQAATPQTDREQAHLQAVDLLMQGRWMQACRVWDGLLIDHPRDALALQWAHLWDFYRGDAAQLRARPARALPEWDADDPLRPCVLGLYAFGLEECHEYAAAEENGRQALQTDPRVPWAIHAVAHVMDMQGRFDDGAAWLRQQQPHWAEGNGFAGHLWWHKGLFRLEAMDLPGALRLLDTHLSGEALQITLQRVDAASLLWRLHLLGVDVTERCEALLAAWSPDPVTAGHYAFNDLHTVLAMLGAGQLTAADTWLAQCAGRVLAAEDAARDNHGMAREVGLPLMRGLLALARHDADGAVSALYAARGLAPRFGGSHAQRDLIDQTLLAACAQGSHKSLGRALLNERLMAKPATPLTRHWMSRIGLPEAARA